MTSRNFPPRFFVAVRDNFFLCVEGGTLILAFYSKRYLIVLVLFHLKLLDEGSALEFILFLPGTFLLLQFPNLGLELLSDLSIFDQVVCEPNLLKDHKLKKLLHEKGFKINSAVLLEISLRRLLHRSIWRSLCPRSCHGCKSRGAG